MIAAPLRPLGAACLALAALGAACQGPRVFVNFPQASGPAPAASGEAAAAPPAAGAEAPAAAAPVRTGSAMPYWVRYATWKTDHRDLLRKLDAANFSLPTLEGMFKASEESLRGLGDGLSAERRAELDGFVARYGELRQEALRDGHRGILRRRLERLGKEIGRRFSAES